MAITPDLIGKPFCDWCGAPNEIITKNVGFGNDPKTGRSEVKSVSFVRCTKLRGLGRFRNASYDREHEGFGHTDDRVGGR